MPLFQILALVVVGTGGLVGGVVGALLPKISNGVAVGVLTALSICIVRLDPIFRCHLIYSFVSVSMGIRYYTGQGYLCRRADIPCEHRH